jgi:hypothetical protein
MDCRTWALEAYLGKKVFVKNGQDEPYTVGILSHFEVTGQSGSQMPIVTYDGEPYLCMSAIMPYSPEIEAVLDAKTPQDQWDFIVYLQNFFTGKHRQMYQTPKAS